MVVENCLKLFRSDYSQGNRQYWESVESLDWLVFRKSFVAVHRVYTNNGLMPKIRRENKLLHWWPTTFQGPEITDCDGQDATMNIVRNKIAEWPTRRDGCVDKDVLTVPLLTPTKRIHSSILNTGLKRPAWYSSRSGGVPSLVTASWHPRHLTDTKHGDPVAQCVHSIVSTKTKTGNRQGYSRARGNGRRLGVGYM